MWNWNCLGVVRLSILYLELPFIWSIAFANDHYITRIDFIMNSVPWWNHWAWPECYGQTIFVYLKLEHCLTLLKIFRGAETVLLSSFHDFSGIRRLSEGISIAGIIWNRSDSRRSNGRRGQSGANNYACHAAEQAQLVILFT